MKSMKKFWLVLSLAMFCLIVGSFVGVFSE